MDPAILKLKNFNQNKEKVVLLENFDIFYNQKMHITKMANHKEEVKDELVMNTVKKMKTK